MRLFVALSLNTPTKEALLAAIQQLRRQGRGNFTRPENLHLTLAFLGEVSNTKPAIKALQQIQAPAFSLTFHRIGHFGDLYWAGVQPSQELSRLHQQATAALQAEGFLLENRLFRPHLTLCREYHFDGPADVQAIEQAMGTPSCPVERIHLMSSSRINGQLTYRSIYSRSLEK